VQVVVEGPAGRKLLDVDWVFNALEPSPNSGPVAGLAEQEGAGWVRVDSRCRTSCPGLFGRGVIDVHR
jgi:thioredoxin reductase